ncbi:snRNA-activating protein complex subunit 4 isoform X3 [Trachinotus anak]
MSVSLTEERDRIQRQVEELEQSLSVTHTELELLSSETGDESGSDDTEDEVRQSAAGLLAQREKIQKEIQNLEDVLGPHSPICVSDDDDDDDDDDDVSSEESELGLSLSVDSCLQMNLVYQQVVQETLDQLETLLTHNLRQQKELVSQLSGPIKEPYREQPTHSSYQQPINMYLGRFLKPYFKDKLTGLGPPANQETKEKVIRMTGSLDDRKLKMKRWESWQKILLIHSVSRDSLRRQIQPKLSRVDYLSQKLSSAEDTDRQQLREQIDSLERDIDLIRGKKEEELIGDRYEEHDWAKISNIDFEGTKDAEDICCFWQNFLHPSINKTKWSQEEVQQLKEVSRRHGERNWESIAQELGTGRTAFMCLQTFQRFVSDSLRRSSWTPDEDALLRELVDKMRIGNFVPYTQMSYFMEGRDPAQLLYRWNQVLDPSLKKGLWTKEEDQLLLRAVCRHGEKNWWKIRSEVPGRTDSACRDRYHDCLKAGTKRGAFDRQERELLLQLVEKHGVGRWAKIAAEIPHRYDAQCLREWRKLSRQRPPPTQKCHRTKNTKSRGGKKEVSPAKRKARRKLVKVKEEECSEEEQEEMLVEYMDSDEEEKKEVVKVKRIEKEEEEEEYTCPPMKEWIPEEKAQPITFLNFRPVALPSSADSHSGKPVRSTILGKFGRSVIIGPNPRELPWEERHSSHTMMMVSADQLQAHLYRQMHKCNNQSSHAQGRVQTSKKKHLRRVTDTALDYELQAAVTPWIGNLLIPLKTRLMAADVLRERREKTQLSSTVIFLLLLQTMNVDTMGCKEIIEQRRNRMMLLSPPTDSSSTQIKDPRTIAGMLQQKRLMRKEQELEEQHKLIMKQLQVLQQLEQHKRQRLQRKQQLSPQQLVLLQQPQPLPPCPPSSMPPQNHSGVLQMPPNMLPQMSPMSFPQAVFIPHPVLQPQRPLAASIQQIPPSSLNTSPPCRPPAVGVVTSLSPPTADRLTVPPVSMVPMLQNATPMSSASVCPVGTPLKQILTVAQPPFPNQAVCVGCTPVNHHTVPSTSSTLATCPSQPCPSPSPPSTTLNPPRGRGQKQADSQEALCSDQKEVDFDGAGNGVDRTCTGVEGTGDGVTREGRRILKLSQKARALQEASKAKAKAKRKAAPCPQKAQAQKKNCLPQTGVLSPPQQLCPASIQLVPQTPASSLTPPHTAPPSLRSNAPPVSVETQTTIPSSSGRNFILAPPTSLANQHSSNSSLHAPLSSDHDYPTPSQRSPAPKPKNPIHCKSDTPLKGQRRSRKRGRGEEQDRLTSCQQDQCAGRPGDTVGEARTGAVQEGKRVRKPSQKARELQEATEAKAEAKKRRTSSSPHKKRPRTSRPKQENVVQPDAQLPGLRLLPGQSMWVMIPGGLVQLSEAPSQGLQLPCVPGSSGQPPPGNIISCPVATHPLQLISSNWQTAAPRPPAVAVPINLQGLNQPRPLIPPASASNAPPPTFVLQPVLNPGPPTLPSCPTQPPSKLFLPYKGTVRVDPAEPPPLRREALQFDPSLMFLEPQAAVRDWLSGRGGVVVPGLDVALPYLPPFVSSLSTLSVLLRAKKALTKLSLQLLSPSPKPQHPGTRPERDGSTETTSSQPPQDLPDSTSDLRPVGEQPASSVSSDLLQEEEEEEELLATVCQLVTERFSGNPAYQLLKARFLSCFTVPALLATIHPEKTVTRPAPQEEEGEEKEEDDEEVELKKIKERGRRRRAERSLLLCDESGAPANHFAGIINTSTPIPNQTRPDR